MVGITAMVMNEEFNIIVLLFGPILLILFPLIELWYLIKKHIKQIFRP